LGIVTLGGQPINPTPMLNMQPFQREPQLGDGFASGRRHPLDPPAIHVQPSALASQEKRDP
jgi:hypothetical protein